MCAQRLQPWHSNILPEGASKELAVAPSFRPHTHEKIHSLSFTLPVHMLNHAKAATNDGLSLNTRFAGRGCMLVFPDVGMSGHA